MEPTFKAPHEIEFCGRYATLRFTRAQRSAFQVVATYLEAALRDAEDAGCDTSDIDCVDELLALATKAQHDLLPSEDGDEEDA
jgi:hypothetical protein